MTNEMKISEDRKKNECKEVTLKVYARPEMRKLGAMQKVTLGGSIGTGDSGAGTSPTTEEYAGSGF